MASNATFLDGGGEAAQAILAADWQTSVLGPIDHWPAALRTAVSMALSSKFPQCIFWGPQLIGLYNDAFKPILGKKPEAMGQPMCDVWREVWPVIRPIAERALAGEATFIEDYALIIDRHGYDEQTYFTFSYSPIRDEDGIIVGIIDTVIETTAKVQAQKSAQALTDELAHRMRNTMTLIAALTYQTYRAAASKEELYQKLNQRIVALGRAHATLTDTQWSGACMQTVIENALAPLQCDSASITLKGPRLTLSARHALSLSLAVHELATNAIKYGALSIDGGHIDIRWRISARDEGELFIFEWLESGAPINENPRKAGFGSQLLERALAEEFQGHVALQFDAPGLRCVLTTKLCHLRPPNDEPTTGMR